MLAGRTGSVILNAVRGELHNSAQVSKARLGFDVSDGSGFAVYAVG